MSEDLFPCPFCGGEPRVMHCGAATYMIQCTGCKVTTDDGCLNRIADLWNRRAPSPETNLRAQNFETPTPPGNQIRTAECDGKDAVPMTGQLPVGTASPQSHVGGVRTVAELPMTAFADAAPQRDEFNGEQTILTYNDKVGVWDLAFFESGEDFPEKWFGDTHWIDITRMWPGVIAQVASFATTEGSTE